MIMSVDYCERSIADMENESEDEELFPINQELSQAELAFINSGSKVNEDLYYQQQHRTDTQSSA